jgi:outer membrane receptor protein involved in Fe transport
MKNIRLLSTSSLGSALILGFAVTMATPAFAQDDSQPPSVAPIAGEDEQTSTNADGSPREGSEPITVTGSRIRRVGYDTLEPGTTVSAEYLETRGLTNVADALNEQPSFGVGITPEGGQSSFGVGQNFVNRFGLGSNRTLTLINGRRSVGSNATTVFGPAAPGQQVDLNIVPSELVDRIENVAIGGAPAYGSDAIAGTVNVILKSDFQGLLVSGTTGITERGDNFRVNGTVIGGTSFAGGRGNVTVALTYDRSEGVPAIQRPRYQRSVVSGTNPLAGSGSATIPGRSPSTDGRVNPGVPFNTGNTDGIPNSVYIENGRIWSLTFGGLLLPATGGFTDATGRTPGFGAGGNTRVQFDRQGNLVPFDSGFPFGAQNASGGQGVLLNETLSLLADLDRYTANLLSRYQVTDNITAFVEGTYYRADSLEIVDQPIYNATLFGGTSSPLIFSATDPRLTAQARAQLATLGVTDFRLSRASRDIVENNARSRQELYRVVGGLEGEFQIGGYDFFWEASANHGRSKGSFLQNVLNQQRFVNAINVRLNAQGQIVCDPAPARNVAPGGVNPVVDSQCVPLDVFGEGRASAAALSYVTDVAGSVAIIEQDLFNVNAGGSLFDLWGAGQIAFVLGYEHRNERGQFTPDEFSQRGLDRRVPILPNGGKYNTDEIFGEILLPLVSPSNNIPIIHRLELEGRARYVDNTVNGGFWTYTAGGRYQPVPDITFRGNYTRSLRAPALVELFTPITPVFNFFPDPCDSTQITSGPSPATRQQNCQAFFTAYGFTPAQAAAFQSTARVATIPQVTGGDPNLANEEARSYTFGVVLQPRFLPRFRAAIDWNRILITGNIASLTPADIASGCYDNPDFDTADVDNANSFCSRFTRIRGGPNNGQLVNDAAAPGVRSGYVNGAFIRFEGLTAEAGYNFPLDGLGIAGGRLDVNGSFFYLHTLEQSNNAVNVDPIAGEIGAPRYAGQINVGYSQGAVGLDLSANYTGKAEFNQLNTVETQDILEIDDQWLFNLGISVQFRRDSFFRIAVTNLFDTQPPFPINGQGTYDTLLRRYAVSVDLRF